MTYSLPALKLSREKLIDSVALFIILASISYRTILPEQVVYTASLLGLFFLFALKKIDNYLVILAIFCFYTLFRNFWLLADVAILKESIRLLLITIPYTLIAATTSKRSILIKRFVLLSIPVPIIGLAGFFNFSLLPFDMSVFVYSRSGGANVRASSIFGNPNYYGAFCFFTISVWLVLSLRYRIGASAFLFVLFLFYVGGIFSLSRSFQLGAALLVPAIIICWVKVQPRAELALLISASILILLVFYTIYSGLLHNPIFVSMFSRWVEDGGGANARFETFTWAAELINRSFWIALFGSGSNPNSFDSVNTFQAHNSFVRISVEYGIIIFVLFFMVISTAIFRSIRGAKDLMFRSSIFISLLIMLFTNDFFLLREFWFFLAISYYSFSSRSEP